MRSSLKTYAIVTLLLGTLGYALAEDVTVTTYYPSPRGIYKQIQTTDDTFLATQGGRVGIGTTAPSTGKLVVLGGNVGIGTLNPLDELHIKNAPVPVTTDTELRLEYSGGPPGTLDAYYSLSADSLGDFAIVDKAPTPSVKRLVVSNTGNVGIGTTAPPTQKLEVAGTTQTQTAILTPLAVEPAPPIEGMMYVNSIDGSLYLFTQGSWKAFAKFVDVLFGDKTSPSDQTITGAGAVVGGPCPAPEPPGTIATGSVCVTSNTTQQGLYEISWEGTIEIDANAGKTATVKIKYGDKVIDTQDFIDEDPPKDTVITTASFEGSTLLLLKNNVSYDIRMVVVKTGGGVNDSTIKAGARLVAKLKLPF